MKSFLSLILLLFIANDQAVGQFSPGKLSAYHAFLEGNSNCIKCHEKRKKELSSGCIDCHRPIKIQMEANRGYHRDKQDNCGECHSDHNGREFELVYWPRDINQFDHSATGYDLTGKHSSLKCLQCHNRQNIKGLEIISWAAEFEDYPVLDRTFLGLSSACQSCHDDVHKDEVSDNCSACHNTTDWKMARKEFDHQQARFLLTGAHKKVECSKCHPVNQLRTPRVWQLSGMAFDQCGRCHQDQHKGAFGSTCETCHVTTGWKRNLKQFDHSITRYALQGKHQQVNCSDCHTEKLVGQQPKFETCLDCHKDYHNNQFADRPDKGNCAACHSVFGYRPTNYSIRMHNSTMFPLVGAHVAVPCNLCHKPINTEGDSTKIRYTWNENKCSNCHSDRHGGQFQTNYNSLCESCHSAAGFTPVNFDHQQTAFPLDGKHIRVGCAKCHFPDSQDQSQIRYYPVAHRCVDCHTITEQIR